jgi:hypothetical protein
VLGARLAVEAEGSTINEVTLYEAPPITGQALGHERCRTLTLLILDRRRPFPEND